MCFPGGSHLSSLLVISTSRISLTVVYLSHTLILSEAFTRVIYSAK